METKSWGCGPTPWYLLHVLLVGRYPYMCRPVLSVLQTAGTVPAQDGCKYGSVRLTLPTLRLTPQNKSHATKRIDLFKGNGIKTPTNGARFGRYSKQKATGETESEWLG